MSSIEKLARINEFHGLCEEINENQCGDTEKSTDEQV